MEDGVMRVAIMTETSHLAGTAAVSGQHSDDGQLGRRARCTVQYIEMTRSKCAGRVETRDYRKGAWRESCRRRDRESPQSEINTY
jgi:hypothetical protein